MSKQDKVLIDEAGTRVSMIDLKRDDIAPILRVIDRITVWNDFGRFEIMVDEWRKVGNTDEALAEIINGEDMIERMLIVLNEFVTSAGIEDMHPEVSFGSDYGTDLNISKIHIYIANDQCGHSHDCCGCGISSVYELIPCGKMWVGTYTYSYNV